LNIPEAKLPDLPLPAIRLPVHLPRIGCPGADARSYIGEQFGSLPDLYDALHIKHLRKIINDQIYALLKGQLPTPLRKPLYYEKALDLIQHIAELIAVFNQVIGQVIAEYNATIAFINQKKGELNQKIAEIGGIPGGSQTAVHRLALQRYNEYIGELDQQVSRLGTSVTCILQIG
jgi:hypothetical protein